MDNTTCSMTSAHVPGARVNSTGKLIACAPAHATLPAARNATIPTAMTASYTFLFRFHSTGAYLTLTAHLAVKS